ncbi:MAG: universal stress protein [Thermoplasmata archaeon]|nr:universal stress protein [Thermoplasmata archaeon]
MKKPTRHGTIKKDFRRIILPVDGSDGSTRAVEKALSLAKETGVNVTALYVMEFPYLASAELSYTYPDVMEFIKKEGNAVLDEVKKQGSKMRVHVKTKLVEGIPDDQIIKEAKKDDLIVMGCKGRTALSRILVGSVCEKVLHHSKSPVMVIR